jgi:hypothetical protein
MRHYTWKKLRDTTLGRKYCNNIELFIAARKKHWIGLTCSSFQKSMKDLCFSCEHVVKMFTIKNIPTIKLPLFWSGLGSSTMQYILSWNTWYNSRSTIERVLKVIHVLGSNSCCFDVNLKLYIKWKTRKYDLLLIWLNILTVVFSVRINFLIIWHFNLFISINACQTHILFSLYC